MTVSCNFSQKLKLKLNRFEKERERELDATRTHTHTRAHARRILLNVEEISVLRKNKILFFKLKYLQLVVLQNNKNKSNTEHFKNIITATHM